MPNVAEHHCEQKWESNDGVEGWIGLSVRRNAVSVNEVLKSLGELVGAIERRRMLFRINDV